MYYFNSLKFRRMLFSRKTKCFNSILLAFLFFGILTFVNKKYLRGKNYAVNDELFKEAKFASDWPNCAEFGVFMPNHSTKKASTNEQLLTKWIMRSNYWQKDIQKTCFFVYLIVETSNILKNFPNNGMNSLFIFVDGVKPTKEFRKKNVHAIFAASDFEDGAFSPSIDVRLYIDLLEQRQKVPILFHKRSHLLSIQMSPSDSTPQNNYYYKKCVEDIKNCKLLFSLEAKSAATFILIFTSDQSNFAKHLYNALSSGTIPVFIEDRIKYNLNYLLPLPDLLEWYRAAIFFPKQKMDFQSMVSMLQNVPKWNIYELRRMGRFYFEHFFCNAKVLIRTILTSVRHRFRIPAPPEKGVTVNVLFQLLPINETTTTVETATTTNEMKRQFFDEQINHLWNMDPTYLDSTSKVQHYWRPSLLQYAQQQINAEFYPKFSQKLSGNWQNDEKFTIVIQAYRRDNQLLYTLRSLDGLRYLDRVIVIWGDITRPITKHSHPWPHIHVPIFVVNTSRDSLNDRFLPFSLIQTEAVLSIDDDFNVEHETIEFSFRVWRENRQRIVGPNYRIGYAEHLENNDLIGVYNGPPRNEPLFQHCQYNIVLTSGAFIHRDFLSSYSNEMPSEIREHVNKIVNCEDIAIAFWVAYLTRTSPLKTTQIGNTIGLFSQNTTGLSSRPQHFAQRSECIKLFSQILGHNPLVLSEYRADSLLYNQQAVTPMKCFKNE